MFRKVRRIAREFVIDCYNSCFNQVEGYVIMLHRIGPPEPERLAVIDELRVSEETLQKFIDGKRKRYDFISLDHLYNRLNGEHDDKKSFICFTMDDGYRDNLTYGLPFFEKNKIPFAVFVTTNFIQKRPAFNFPFILERIVYNNESLLINGEMIDCSSRDNKNLAFRRLKENVLNLPYENFEDSFMRLMNEYIKPDYYENLFLDEKDLCKLSSSPLCTIGAHTITHCRLSNVPNACLEYELRESKKQIESMIDSPCQYVSYPFGWISDIDDRVIEKTQEIGYKCGFISHGGAVRKHDHDFYRLKRLMLTEK